MNRHLNWMILLGLLLFSLTGNAQSNKVMKVLWVGNSFTFYNDMPKMVRDIAATQNVKLSITKFLKGGDPSTAERWLGLCHPAGIQFHTRLLHT